MAQKAASLLLCLSVLALALLVDAARPGFRPFDSFKPGRFGRGRHRRSIPAHRSVFRGSELGMSFMCVQRPRRVRRVFENHFRQLNRCSLRGLRRERTPYTQLFFGDTVIKGKYRVDAVFRDFCRPRAKGGLRGLFFKEEKSVVVGNVISVQWVAYAPFLRKPYRGSDAYVTCGNKMITIVSSFDRKELKFRKRKKRGGFF